MVFVFNSIDAIEKWANVAEAENYYDCQQKTVENVQDKLKCFLYQYG